MSGNRLLGAHLPAANPARRETVAGECLGCRTQFAIDVRLPLPARCPDCGADVLARADIEGPGTQHRLGFDAPRVREGEAVTSRFIVGRILRELIELAERDEDAELVDVLHDALDVASPGGASAGDASNRGRRAEGVNETPGPGPRLLRLGIFRRGRTATGAGRDRDCPVLEGCLSVAGARPVAAAGCSRSRWTRHRLSDGDDGRGGGGAAPAGTVRGGGVPGEARAVNRNPIICADNGTTRSPDSGLVAARSVRRARATPSFANRTSFVSPSWLVFLRRTVSSTPSPSVESTTSAQRSALTPLRRIPAMNSSLESRH